MISAVLNGIIVTFVVYPGAAFSWRGHRHPDQEGRAMTENSEPWEIPWVITTQVAVERSADGSIADSWAVTRDTAPEYERVTAYWDGGGFLDHPDCWVLDLATETEEVQTFATKAEAIAAVREGLGRMPKTYQAVQLPPVEVSPR